MKTDEGVVFNKRQSRVIQRFQWEIELPLKKLRCHPPPIEAGDILI